MVRALNKLTARTVAAAKEKGRYSDGGGLYLIVDEAGSKRWVVYYQDGKARRELGAGSIRAVTLAQARERAAEVRSIVAAGGDPKAKVCTPLPETAHPTSFGDAALAYMADRELEGRSAIHRQQ